MQFPRKKNIIIFLIIISPAVLLYCFIGASKYQEILHKVSSKEYVYTTTDKPPQQELPKKLENPPDIIRAVYITGSSAGSKKYLDYLYALLQATKINAVVVDIKDHFGIVSYQTEAKKAKEYRVYSVQIPDINALIKELHGRGIYVIGRIAVFEDSFLAQERPDLAVYDTLKTKDKLTPVLWEDASGAFWLDPSSQEVRDYNIDIALDAASHGFDEIHFDYVAFPTGGQSDAMGFPFWSQHAPKTTIIKSFFKKVGESFPDTKTSVSLFGQITTSTTDMGTGQIFEDALKYFDYVCPMLYPSHYASGFLGYKNPAEHPYEIVTYAMESALARKKVFDALQVSTSQLPQESASARIRPWLQDFNRGADYTAAMVGQEIQAVNKAAGKDFSGFLLWNPLNIYTRDAVLK